MSNDKPSAIFRLRGSFSAQSSLNHAAFQADNTPSDPSGDATAVLGISIEPLTDIQAQISALPNAVARPAAPDATALAEKIVKHLFNYLSSFATESGPNITPESFVQMRTITRWYDSFVSKIRTSGLAFLDRQE